MAPNILIINDGCRRWAMEHGLPLEEGYKRMVEKIALICGFLNEEGFSKVHVTLSSVHNLDRSREEVFAAFGAFLTTPKLCQIPLRIRLHGNLDLIPLELRPTFDLFGRHGEDTPGAFELHYMVNWSLEDEIVRIYNSLHSRFSRITREILRDNADITDQIDLIIRTGFRQRLSSCVPINSPFAEIKFLEILFPDITLDHIKQTLSHFASRVRTFGK